MKDTEAGSYIDPNERTMDKVRLKAFPFVLQALYNVTTMLGAKLAGKEHTYYGSPITASLVDSKIIMDTLADYGIYPRFKSVPDPNTGFRNLSHFSDKVLKSALGGTSVYQEYRDEYVESLKSHLAEVREDFKDIREKVSGLEHDLRDQDELLDTWENLLFMARGIVGEVRGLIDRHKTISSEAKASGLAEKLTAFSVKLDNAVPED